MSARRRVRTKPLVIGGRPPGGAGRVRTPSGRSAHRSPQAAYIGGARPARRRSRRNVLGPMLVIIALLAVTGGVATWLLTRPAAVTITAEPADAVIAFNGASSAGKLDAADLEPGAYPVRVERKGFEPFEANIVLKRGKHPRLEYELKPLPQTVTLDSHPGGAACVITCANGLTFEGKAPFSAEVPAGPATISIAHDGCNTYTRELFLDEEFSLDLWLDPEGQLLHALGMFETSGAPKGVVITPDKSEVWATILDGPPSIEIFDPLTGRKLGGVDIGEHGAVEVIFSSDGTRAYASQMETAKVFEIDVASRKVLREFDTESAWTKVIALSPDGATLYAANWSGNDVSEIDLTSGQLRRRVPVSKTPRGLWPTADGRTLYVAGFDSGWLDKIDLATGKVTAVFKGGGALRHLVADEKTGRLYISDMSEDLVWVHDMKTGKTSELADVDHKPNTIDLSADGKVLFVSCRGANNPKSYYIPGPEWGSIVVLDATTGKPLDAVVCGNQPTALDVSDDGSMLVMSDFLDNRLRIYQVPGYDELAAGDGGRYAEHFADIKK